MSIRYWVEFSITLIAKLDLDRCVCGSCRHSFRNGRSDLANLDPSGSGGSVARGAAEWQALLDEEKRKSTRLEAKLKVAEDALAAEVVANKYLRADMVQLQKQVKEASFTCMPSCFKLKISA